MSQPSNETGSPVTPDTTASDLPQDPGQPTAESVSESSSGVSQPPPMPNDTVTPAGVPEQGRDAGVAEQDDTVAGVAGHDSAVADDGATVERATVGTDPADDQTTVLTDTGGDATYEQADSGDATMVMPAAEDDPDVEHRITRDELYARQDRQGERERLAAIRAEHEAATGQNEPVAPAGAGGSGAAAATTTAAKPLTRKERRQLTPVTDRFFGSLGLLVLRWTLAVAFGAHGVQKLLSMDQTAQFFDSLQLLGMPLPAASALAIATGVAEVMIAVSLIFGFLTRFAGIGMLLIGVGALLMVKWTEVPNPLAAGASGVEGELELILAGAGVLFLCLGAGGWSLDRLFRRDRPSGLESEEA